MISKSSRGETGKDFEFAFWLLLVVVVDWTRTASWGHNWQLVLWWVKRPQRKLRAMRWQVIKSNDKGEANYSILQLDTNEMKDLNTY